jgi:hypothetical protein
MAGVAPGLGRGARGLLLGAVQDGLPVLAHRADEPAADADE